MPTEAQKELERIEGHANYSALRQLDQEGLSNFGLFVGAGLSQSAGLKGWEATLHFFLTNTRCLGRIPNDINSQIKEMIKSKRYTYAAHLIRHFVGDGVFQQCLEEEFDRQARLPEGIREALENCCDSAGIRLIVTTNFDRVLEDSLYRSVKEKREWLTLTHRHCDRVRNELSKGSRVIFKVHGDIKDFKSIVLTQSDYQRLYYSRNEFSFLLARLLDSYTFLFLGFSLDDPFFSTVLDTLSAYYGSLKQNHFALLPDTSRAEAIAWEDLRGVRVIPYNVNAAGGHEPALFAVLRAIEGAALELRVVDLTFDWLDIGNWSNFGANPEITEEGGAKVLRANYTERSNCSIHRPLGNVLGGRIVRARVKFKCDSGKYGMIFIGDAGGSDPYDNSATGKKQGNGEWQELAVEIKYVHEDICQVYLYGNRDDGKPGDFVLYKDLEVTMLEPVR